MKCSGLRLLSQMFCKDLQTMNLVNEVKWEAGNKNSWLRVSARKNWSLT